MLLFLKCFIAIIVLCDDENTSEIKQTKKCRNFNNLINLIYFNQFFFRFGRLTVVVVGMQLNSIFGMIKTFSINYPMYVAVSGQILIIWFHF